MRDLLSNTRDIWYAVYLGETDAVDDSGDITGEKVENYAEPVKVKLNLSATRGTQGFTGTGLSYDYFGADVKYDLILSTARMDLPINEYSLIWDSEPETDGNGNVLFNRAKFRVTAVARGLHHMKYAVRTRQMTVHLPTPTESDEGGTTPSDDPVSNNDLGGD